ncbi:MAG: GTP cyclohydrolase FolE2 [Thioalkalivibrionaceae bacterium]
MNAPHSPQAVACPIEDVQSHHDDRQIAIKKVGIRRIRHPLRWADGDSPATVAEFDLYVSLPADQKGTHMSRFVALLNEQVDTLDLARFRALLHAMRARLEADAAHLHARMAHFVLKTAPVSGIASLLDYELALHGSLTRESEQDLCRVDIEVLVPVTSLCPCSKQISEYGAHNQRSHVTARVEVLDDDGLTVQSLIDAIESQASSQLYGLLKRTDEKFVTEHAYDHPKFVEDLVRDVATAVAALPGIGQYVITAENFESIHNHSAYAEVHGHADHSDDASPE